MVEGNMKNKQNAADLLFSSINNRYKQTSLGWKLMFVHIQLKNDFLRFFMLNHRLLLQINRYKYVVTIFKDAPYI
jgi:hypothetical protein